MKKKVFTGVTCATNNLELTHNFGVIPKFIVVEDDNHQAALADYGMGEIFYAAFAPVETITFQNQLNGVITCRNRSSGNQSSGGMTQVANIISSPGYYTVSTTSLLLKPYIGNSDWTVAPSYTVTLYY